MPKPIVVCGVDFSGTSLLAGILHTAGVDMGDVESAADVLAQPDRPMRYRLFEDRSLQDTTQPIASGIMEAPHHIDLWLNDLFHCFQRYLRYREEKARGTRWGVKQNLLTLLTLHPDWHTLDVDWITTRRPFAHSFQSAREKLGSDPRLAAFLGVQYLAWTRLQGIDMMDYPEIMRGNLWPIEDILTTRGLPYNFEMLYAQIDPHHGGRIPWPQHGLPLQVSP